MSLSIFWRLILSHLGILLLAGAACLYSIIQLGSLTGIARSALDSNHRMIDYQEGLTDSFLSQVRYGGKYLLTHADGRHEQMQQFKKDFNEYLERLKALGPSGQIIQSITQVERFYRSYHELFDREVEYIQRKQNYAQSRFQQERDKIVESAINELDGLKALVRTKLQEALEGIEHGARTSRRIAIGTTLFVVIFGTLLALKVSNDLAGSPSRSEPAYSAANLFALTKLKSLRVPKRSLFWLAGQRKRWTPFSLTLNTAWKRCATIWNYPSTRKGG
jgi:CHASE3 domain sensor protein